MKQLLLIIIFILFSVNVFANPFESIFRGLERFSEWKARWGAERSIKKRDLSPAHFALDRHISEAGKREALDIIASGTENDLYYSLYSHILEKFSDREMVRLFETRDPREATDLLVIALVGMKRHERNWIEMLWRETDMNIFLKLWNMEPARPIMASFIRRDHLIDNPNLLLKYWKERRRGYNVGGHVITVEDRLIYFIHLSMNDIRDTVRGVVEPEVLLDKFWTSPLGETIIRASREEDQGNFFDQIQSIAFIESRRVRRYHDPSSGNFASVSAIQEAELYRGRLFDELIQSGSYPESSLDDVEESHNWLSLVRIGSNGV